ncbi:MAG: replicative DNA helicase [Candidatus Dojkabacteria bacterium]
MDNLRIPPQNLDAEKAVIASVLIDTEAINKILEIVRPEHFYDPRHQMLFEVIIKLNVKARPIDVITVNAELSKMNKVRQAGGTEYISEIVSTIPTAANVEEYARIVKETAVRRHLITYSGELEKLSRDATNEIDDVLDSIEKNVLSISKDNAKTDFLDSATLLEMQMKRADEFAKNPDALRGMSTGLNAVDKMLGGLQNSDLIILAARPSVGKSAFSFDIARHIAVHEKKTIAIFSLEMPAIQVIERMLAQQIQVNLWNLRMGKMSDDDFKRYSEGAGKLADAKIFIDDTPGINIIQLRSKARKLMMEHDLNLIIIDYLQLMQGTGKISSDNRAQEVGEISRSLKILARELNIPIIALSQLNRAVENRQDKIPQLSDLRESGSIEQDADLVIFLARELNEEVTEHEAEFKVDIFIAKHRNGPTGRFKLKFVGAKQKYYDVEQDN